MGLTKAQLEALNDSSFPNNNGGLITPQVLRDYNDATIANTVNQDAYTADSASFNTRILAVTGSSIATGSFATTGSNTFVGNQTINAELILTGSKYFRIGAAQSISSGIVTNGLTIESQGGNLIRNLAGGGNITLENTQGIVNISGTATQIQGVDFIPFSASLNTRILAVTGSSIATGSFATTGSNTFFGPQFISGAYYGDYSSSNQPVALIVSGGIFPYGDNMFDIGSDEHSFNKIVVNGELKGSSLNTSGRGRTGTLGFADESFPLGVLDSREIIGDGSGANTHMYYATSSSDVNGLREFAYVPSGSPTTPDMNILSASFASTIAGITTGTGFATTGSNTFFGNQTISTTGNSNLTISSSTGGQSNIFLQSPVGSNLTAYGQLNIGNNGASGGSGSIRVVVNSRDIELGADSGVAIGPVNISGNGVATGAIKLLAHSGSLILSNNSFTNNTGSLLHLSSSNNTTLANFIFKANNNTGSTQISGSGNIFTNPGLPTAGRVNYVGGTTNLFLNGQSSQLPQITGSAASVSGNRPTMNANIINGTQVWTINQAVNTGAHVYTSNILAGAGSWVFNMLGNTGPVTVSNNLGLGAGMTLNAPSRSIAQVNAGESGSNNLQVAGNSIAGTLIYNGPVSCSFHGITSNNIAGGLTLNVQSQSRQINLSSNIINGNANINDNTYNPGNIGSNHSITNNNINGNFTLNQRASSSIFLSNNNINTWTISNDYDATAHPTPSQRFLQLAGNALFGTTGNNLYASGSTSAISASRSFTNNLFAGQNISASLISDNSAASMIGTIGAGGGLSIEGTVIRDASNTGGNGATIGSAFFGRWNKTGQGFNTTGEVVLAIGTGTSGSAGITRKTGFLIDSGSNAFFEGTFNVSGSTTMTGSLSIAPTFEVKFATGSNQQAGTAVLDGSNPGAVTVSNSLVTANSIIMVSKQTLAHPNGYVAVSAKSAGSFTITSNHNGDTDTVGWFVINNS